MSKTIKAAVVQAGPVLFDTPKTMSKLADLARQAAGLAADLVVFPEAFVGGYPKGIDFGELRIDVKAREVQVRGAPVTLTAREYDLLAFLAQSPRQVFSGMIVIWI